MTEKGRQWGRFELLDHLGAGGMGDVYRAYDPRLKRHLALKILRKDDAEVLTRFVRESQAQAQVEHPHVCKIYESGECEGQHYIAMQFIDGRTLMELKNEMNLEEKVAVIRGVAEGLHAAHRQGLIHRDVKPSNIMARRGEDGKWQPFVMDFGIAREQAAPGITSTGVVVGTPFYMSPEQAKGRIDALDRRSDVYSLGVTLYELLGGKMPIEGNTPVEILMNILQKDPQPLRKVNPNIPVDLDTIVMKCLEKDPQRRYGTARELADDLQRFLDGDPIQARQTTLIYRIKRKLIKYKWVTVVTAVASVVILALFGLWLHTKWQASQRALIAQELGQEVEKIESTIQYAHLLPLHDITREKALIRRRMRGIEEKMAEVGAIGEGPGNFALGRGHMALQEYESAREHLQAAWDSGYQIPEVAFELGRTLGELYLRESERAGRIDNPEIQAARQKKVEQAYREPAVRYLSLGSRTQVESKPYVETLIRFYEKDYTAALTVVRQAKKTVAEGTPWQYETTLLEGNIHLTIGMEKSDWEEAKLPLANAEKAFLEVIRIGESDIRGYLGMSRVLERRIMIKLFTRGGDLQPLVDRAIAQCDKALRIDAKLPEVHTMVASVYRWLGRHRMIAGLDAEAPFEKAITAAQNALKLQPDNHEAHTIMGITQRLKGQYRMNLGEDPTPEFTAAAHHFGEAIRINPTYVMAYNGLGNVQVRRAQYEINHGKDPDLFLKEAIANYEKALSINPNIVNLYNGLAGAHWFQGGALMARGRDPRPAYRQAITQLGRAIRVSPGIAHFYSNLGFVYSDVARYELQHGIDPLATLARARDNLQKALSLNPKGNELHLGMLNVIGLEMRCDLWQGRDGGERLGRAREYFSGGLSANPQSFALYLSMADALVVQARYALDGNGDADDLLGEAENLRRRAESLNPKYHEVHALAGEIALLRARRRIAANGDPSTDLQRAESLLRRALAMNPKDTGTYLVLARLKWWAAEREMAAGGAPGGTIVEGLNALKKVLALNPNLAEAHVMRGILLFLDARITEDAAAAAEKKRRASAAVQRGFRINPSLEDYYRKRLPDER